MVWVLVGTDVHLAVATVELKAEMSSVGQYKRERFAPFRLAPAVLHAPPEGIAQTVAALHEWAFLVGMKLESR